MYHLSIKIISRGKGKSAVAAAAYRAGERIVSEYDGRINDYTRKRGIIHTEIMLPVNAPAEYRDRAVLWNAVDKTEKAKNSQLAREIEIALPRELTESQNLSLVREYVKVNFVDKGMCADIAIHDNKDGNPHAHVLLTMRPFNVDKTWGDKQKKVYHLDNDGNKIYDPKKRQYKCGKVQTTDWNERTKAEEWRAAWADIANRYLKNANHDKRIDHRSYARQGINKIPTIHLGVAAHQMEKRGIRTERGDINRSIEITNKELRQLRARISKLEKWIADESKNSEMPTLYDVVSGILNRQGQSRSTRLKDTAQMLIFLQENNIMDMDDLERKVNDMQGSFNSMRDNLKKVERRIGTLGEHLRHCDNIVKHRKIKRHYDELYSQYEVAQKSTGFGAKRKAEKALVAANDFYESFRAELTLYDAADNYMRGVLQKRYDPKKLPPVKKWRDELVAKTAEKNLLYREYDVLKNETAKVEKIRYSVKEIVDSERQTRPIQKSQGLEF